MQSTRKSPRFFDATAVRRCNRQQLSESLPRTPQRARDQAQRAEPAIRRQRGVEIVFKIFTCQITHGADAIKRQPQILRCARRACRFHFYYRCTGRPQVAFFRRSLCDALNRYHGAVPEGFCCPWNQRLICPHVIADLVCDYDVAHIERLVERSAEPDIAHRRGLGRDQHRGECPVRSRAIRDRHHLAPFRSPCARPHNRQRNCADILPMRHQTGALTRVGRDKQQHVLLMLTFEQMSLPTGFRSALASCDPRWSGGWSDL